MCPWGLRRTRLARGPSLSRALAPSRVRQGAGAPTPGPLGNLRMSQSRAAGLSRSAGLGEAGGWPRLLSAPAVRGAEPPACQQACGAEQAPARRAASLPRGSASGEGSRTAGRRVPRHAKTPWAHKPLLLLALSSWLSSVEPGVGRFLPTPGVALGLGLFICANIL